MTVSPSRQTYRCFVCGKGVTDKSVAITPNKNLSGAEDYPVYVGKGIVI